MTNKSIVRFAVVGLVNTGVDVTIFLLLSSQGLPIIVANTISTSVALGVSFLLNYKFTFRAQKITARSVFTYVGVTLVGLWLLQPIVIHSVLAVLEVIPVTQPVIALVGHAETINNTFAKLASIAVTLVWNYLWYSKVVFRNKAQHDPLAITPK